LQKDSFPDLNRQFHKPLQENIARYNGLVMKIGFLLNPMSVAWRKKKHHPHDSDSFKMQKFPIESSGEQTHQ